MQKLKSILTRVYFLFTGLLIASCGSKNDIYADNLTGAAFEEIKEELTLFNIPKSDYTIIQDTVKKGWSWGDVFLPFGISQVTINKVAEIAKNEPIGLNYIVAGKPFNVFTSTKDTLNKTAYIVYEPDPYSFITFDFTSDSVKISKSNKPVKYIKKTVYGEIEPGSNLSLALNKKLNNYAVTAELAEAIEGVYAWSIDFFKLQVGDQFVVNYEEKQIDGQPFGIGKIDAIWFNHSKKGSYAFYYMTDSTEQQGGYYDETGLEKKRPFLMSPVKFARITSGYSKKRFHPVYKHNRPHLGTDYAAPTGTPILATADGTVTKATRGRANGIFVKLRHNSVYETQYLHMSKIAAGIKPGKRVQQGDVIGYVGSTGAATGPHVCYRFWKNGKQVNHRAESFPNSEPMDKALVPNYLAYIQPKKEQLDLIIQQAFHSKKNEFLAARN